jgi:hypothetical protein
MLVGFDARRFMRAVMATLIGTTVVFSCRSSLAEKASMTESSMHDSSTSCAARLRSFISEIDDKIETSPSVEPLQKIIRKYFPLSGCKPDEVVSIAQQSTHFDRADHFKKDVVVVFRKKTPGTWGFQVSFAISKETGKSRLPTAMVDKIRREEK